MKKFTILLVVYLFLFINHTNAQTFTNYTVESTSTLCNNYVRAIAIDAQDTKWFGTNGGISKFDGTNWTTYDTLNGLAIGYVSAIAIDAEGNKWFGTEDGVSKFDDTTWTTYAVGWVKEIAIDAEGNKWFGTYGGGVSKFDGTNWTTYTTSNGLASNYINAIAIDAEGNKCFGTYQVINLGHKTSLELIGTGVSKFDGTTWATYTTADGLGDNRVSSI